MALNRIRVAWAGPGLIGPGVSTFYMLTTATTGPSDLVTFFTAIKALFPTGTTLTIPSVGDTIDETTGAITGAWAIPGGATVTATGTGVFALGTGIRVKWTTAGIHAGRRVRGETFLVPCTSATFDGTGNVGAATVSAVTTAAGNLLLTNPGVFKIWSRPKVGASGIQTGILGAVVPYLPTSLRSRRV